MNKKLKDLPIPERAAEVKRLGLLKWQWISDNKGDGDGFFESFPELEGMPHGCAFCEAFRAGCVTCPLFVREYSSCCGKAMEDWKDALAEHPMAVKEHIRLARGIRAFIKAVPVEEIIKRLEENDKVIKETEVEKCSANLLLKN